jgi:hypothetical protein
MYPALTPMATSLLRIGKRILDHLNKKEAENLQAKFKLVPSERGHARPRPQS